MSYEVTLTPEAKRDLREIYRYIAVDLQSEQNANGQLDRLEENILKLDEMPERFRVYGATGICGSCRWTIIWCSTFQTTRQKPLLCSALCTAGGILTPSLTAER